jgi:DNA polymerase III epsilon subunit family exonuclease
MGTDDAPLPDLRLVPDAALPEPDELQADIVLGLTLPRPAAVSPAPEAIDAECDRATRMASGHLARLQRRAARHPRATPDGWAVMPLEEARFCVIDLETTGTGQWGEDEILEVGAVRLSGGELGLELSTLVQPAGSISPAAQRIHHIAPAMVSDAPPIAAVLPSLLEACRDCVLVFHNAPFDLGFLQRALAGADREPLTHPVVDTLVVARQLLGGRCGLGELGRRLGLPAPHLHRALADARLTAQLLLVLTGCLRAAGARVVGDIPGIASRPVRVRHAHGGAAGLLARQLGAAAAAGRVVQLAVRLGPGLVPQEMLVVPLEVRGALCLLRQCDDHTPFMLAIERIEALRFPH